MGKIFTTRDGYKIEKVGRIKKLYFVEKGIYFMWGGRRVYLDEVPRVSFPIMFDDAEGKLNVIGGYIPFSNTMAVLVQIDEISGEAVQLWRERDA